MKTYAQMDATRAHDSLCGSCQHRYVCRMAQAIATTERRPGDVMHDSFLIAVSQCYHYKQDELEDTAPPEVIR